MSGYMNAITIDDIREHTKVKIEFDPGRIQHLIFTGKNGSGKTAVLKAIEGCIEDWCQVKVCKSKIFIEFNENRDVLKERIENNKFIVGYYGADRDINESSIEFIEKLCVDDKMREQFQEILKVLLNERELKITRKGEVLLISIKEKVFTSIHELSRGQIAVIEVATSIISKMQYQDKYNLSLNTPGIIMIDAVEAHLHLEMQKTILSTLIRIFPNIQFILSTHSPFVLNSVKNAMIYDLSSGILVVDGLNDISYEGVVEGYFGVSIISDNLKNAFERYKKLLEKNDLEDDDFMEIALLESRLEKIPDFLNLGIVTEYHRLRLEFDHR